MASNENMLGKKHNGKTIVISTYDEFRYTGATTDAVNLKSIWIDIESYANLISIDKQEIEEMLLEIRLKTKRKIQNQIDKNIFQSLSIVDYSLRLGKKQLYEGKKTFFVFQINLFVKKHMDVKDPSLKLYITNFVHEIIDEILLEQDLIRFSIK